MSIKLVIADDDALIKERYIRDGIKNGAKGYLLKNTKPDRIIQTTEMVNDGNYVIQDEILIKLSNNLNKKEFQKSNMDKSIFTERELEVIKAISEGLNNKEISRLLYISEGTVKNHITSIFQKSGLAHRTQIAIYYIRCFS
ncbi:response regulator transcription factor [Clostridium sp. D46t1_190503_E9]|uniref:response regulator transcription factor n=1 Tax=Clostridium sp. D46t1_190503_E9 TaxID=2787137 RepID=UPI00189BDA7F|nr:response regulator transcription factor [Clostridium sp. D46t1_190503_E9]